MKKKIKKFIDRYSTTAKTRLIAVYMVFTLLFVLFHMAYTAVSGIGFITGMTAQKKLTLTDFRQVDVKVVNSNTLITTSDDGQLIYTGGIRNLYVECDFSADIGEFVCFYNSRGNDAFGTHKMLHAKFYDGYYVFEFPVGTKQIRLDMGVIPSVTIDFEKIQINKPTISTIADITVGDMFTLLVVPGLGFMVVETILSFRKKK